jgi:7-keto-8-aminopelargonate synthetase-like enzyme
MSWTAWAEEQLAAVRRADRWRRPRTFDARGPEGRLDDGRPVVSFASNDYLGLTAHPAVAAAAIEAVAHWGTGAGSARLVVGSRPVHDDLERALADWKRCEAAILFPTGYAANLGVLTTFGSAGTRILSDERNHASIVDGARLAKADVAVYRHLDLDHLASLLADDPRPAIVVSDLVFSMDGDVADEAALADLCTEAGALLVLDEAHAVLHPRPPAEPHPQPEPVDETTGFRPGTSTGSGRGSEGEVLRVGTLSKTLASLGGFVAGPRAFVDLLVNRARSYIFTTASTPADAAAALAALDVVRSPEGQRLRATLAGHVERLAPGHPSPIIPVVVGDEQAALDASAALLDEGLLVPAIRPPTVAAGTSRLRVALSAAHTADQVDQLAHALDRLGLRGVVAPA